MHYAIPTTVDVTCKRCAESDRRAAQAAAKPVKVQATPKARKVAAAGVSLVATVGSVQVVRQAEADGTVWTLHCGAGAFYVALTKADAMRVAQARG